MATVLITGINGFTGRHLAQALRAVDYRVVGIGLQSSQGVYACNLLDPAGLVDVLKQTRPEFIVHLAGVAAVNGVAPEKIYLSNVVGTRNLLEAVVVSGCKPQNILLASSANVYGNSTIGVLDETVVVAPANDYAVSKLAMEHLARIWSTKLPITIVRPFNYTGVGQSTDFVLSKIVDAFARRLPVLELGNINVVRDFSDVRVVVQRYLLLMEARQPGETFNVCSETGYSLSDVLKFMRELSGFDPEIKVNPAYVRENEVYSLIGARQKLDSVIGRIPDVPLQETLRWMLDDRA